MASTPTISPNRKPRDQRLDFWRGLCLIDMVLVHLVYQGVPFGRFAPWLGEYTRFAAGGFIFIAGLSIAAIYLPRLSRPGGVRSTYTALFKRSFYILLVHYAAEISLLLLWPLFGADPFPSVRREVTDILLLRKGYDLLPFYVVMLAVTPLLLECIRRGAWYVVAIASVAVFAWGRGNGFANAYYIAFDNQQAFYVVFWQLIFVAGMLFGLVLKRYDTVSMTAKRWVTAGCVAALAILWILCYGHDFGIKLNSPLAFWKVPLTLGETLRYLTFVLAVITVTDLLWRKIDGRRWSEAVALLGRNSLAVYVMHIWVVQFAVHGSARLPVWPNWVSAIVYPAVSLAVLVAFAAMLERRKSQPATDWRAVVRSPFLRVPAMGAAAALLLLVVNTSRMGRFPVDLVPDETHVTADASVTAGGWIGEREDDTLNQPASVEGTGEVEEDFDDVDFGEFEPLELPAEVGIVG